MTQTTKATTVAKNAPALVGKRVKITLEGHKSNGINGTVVSQSRTNYSVQVPGTEKLVSVVKTGVKTIRGRKLKNIVTA